jgi:transcriptional regulator with XRE-family HTH domain
MYNAFRLAEPPRIYPRSMADDIDPARQGFGQRLAGARELKGLTQAEVGERFGVGKGTVSAWETGRGDPGVFRLAQLAKLYNVTADALLSDSAPTIEAMQFAAQYDSLTEAQKSTLRILWMGWIQQAAEGGESLPMPPSATPTPPLAPIPNARRPPLESEVRFQPRLPPSAKSKKTG